MPTTYAHWYFGNECIDVLPDDLKDIVNNNREFFNTGTNGPDVFFYNLLDSKTAKFGHDMHKESPRSFFMNAIKVYKENDNNKDEMMSYLLGFLTHYVLDSQTHSYIERKKEVSNISHNKVEAEYDGHLMRKQGLKVKEVNRSEPITAKHENTQIISRFYPLDEESIYKAFKWHKFIINFFNCKTPIKYNFLIKTGNKILSEANKDLPIKFEEDEICKDSNLRLDKLKEKALVIYKELVTNFIDALNNGKELDAYFDHNFNQWDNYKDIKILSYEDELNYKI